jgi:hypothetical protein
MQGLRSSSELEWEIDALAGLPREDLLERWEEIFKKPPPKGLSLRLLRYAIGYELQAKHYGGLSARAKKQLRCDSKNERRLPCGKASKAKRLCPGTRLIREWNGKTHVVEVIERGFLWNGDPYQSLSAIARAITGARWSGPRFFDLRDKIS